VDAVAVTLDAHRLDPEAHVNAALAERIFGRIHGEFEATVGALFEITGATSLRVADRYYFGRHYAETLRRWRERFEAQAGEVADLGFDETFRRMWSLYLAYSEAGFRTGYLDVAQFTLTKPTR